MYPIVDLNMRVLIIEDDETTASYIQKGLAEAGYIADIAVQGDVGLSMAVTGNYQALIIDRMLPVINGLAVIAALRTQNNTIPILILSALGDVDQRVEGLKAGGDDYLTKPFAFSELLARLEALARRGVNENRETTLTEGDLVLNLLTREVKRGSTLIDLQPREFRLLEYLMCHSDQVVTRTMLLENVWDYNFDPQTNVIDVHISRLRAKIDKNFDTPLLITVRGAGYILRATKA